MSAPRAIPTSRAYWDLQAEKLMNRIFDPEEPIDLENSEAADAARLQTTTQAQAGDLLLDLPPHSPRAEPAPRRHRARRPAAANETASRFSPGAEPSPAVGMSADEPAVALEAPTAIPARSGQERRRPFPTGWTVPHQPLLLLAVFAGAGLITAASGVLALSQWTRFQESLQQERNLLLVERLRSFGPGAQPAPPATPPAPALDPPAGSATSTAPATSEPAATNSATQASGDDAGLPPPPPSEPWIEQLSELPQARPVPPLLRVPLNARLAAPAAPVRRRTPSGPLPLLVGVVAAPGKAGSAIFQMGGSTSTVGVGDSIGSSGWRLRSTDGDSVQVEHEGEVRRITIGSGG